MSATRIRTCDLEIESHTLTTQPRTLNKQQTLATNKAENRCYASEISI